MVEAPVHLVPNPAGTGAPVVSEEQYQKWLDEMAPFLKLGETLSSSIEDAGLFQHRASLYKKYRLKDWFADKVDAFRATPGKLAHNVLANMVKDAQEAQKQGRPVSEDTMKNVRFYAEKARVSQPYFVNRTETAEGQPIEDLLEELEKEDTVDDATSEAKKQMVEAQPPIQNQEQSGETG